MSYYDRDIYNEKGEVVATIDLYDIADMYGVSFPPIYNAWKKITVPGGRGTKALITDLKEARGSLDRAIDILERNAERVDAGKNPHKMDCNNPVYGGPKNA